MVETGGAVRCGLPAVWHPLGPRPIVLGRQTGAGARQSNVTVTKPCDAAWHTGMRIVWNSVKSCWLNLSVMSFTLKSLDSVTITADPEPCTQLLDVPAALLAKVLQHVPLQDRLGVCTRVCRSFNAAAVAATNSISMSMSSQSECDQLAEWLQRNGAGLTALHCQYKPVHTRPYVQVPKPSLASLPCPQLRDLNLCGLYLQPGFLSTCTGLTRLLLSDCRMQRMPVETSSMFSNPLMQLSVLSSLQHLGLGTVEADPEGYPHGVVPELPSKLLSHLVQLTYLQLADRQVQSDAALQHLSTVSALQHLELSCKAWGLQRLSPAALTGLQHLRHLTALQLNPAPWAINLQNMPAVTVLTALHVLQLRHSLSVDPAVLAGFSGLQEVDLQCKEAWDDEGSAVLLAAIGQQAQLRRLAIFPTCCWSLPSAAGFSALTASSYLQHLELRNCGLPTCAWRQVFPPGRRLPELRHLVLQAIKGEAPLQISHEDMQAMVSCCPALVDLNLGGQLAVSTAVPLQHLTGLTHLDMHASFQDVALSIARLTGLELLYLYALEPGDRVTVSGLLQLTVLQQLRYMTLQGASCDPGLACSEMDPDRVHILNKAPAGAPRDVWLQLKERCEAAQVQAG